MFYVPVIEPQILLLKKRLPHESLRFAITFSSVLSYIIQTAAAIHAISRRVRDPNTNAPITFLLSRVSAGFATISMNERELIAVFVKLSVKPLILVGIIIFVERSTSRFEDVRFSVFDCGGCQNLSCFQ